MSSPPPRYSGPRCRDRWITNEHYNQCCKWWPIRVAIGYTVGSIVLAIVGGIVLLVLRFGLSPGIKVHVEDARLDRFGFVTTPSAGGTATTFLDCSISVGLNVRNSNRAMSMEYTRPLVATFVFFDRRLFNVTVAEEGHRHPPRRREEHLLRTDEKVPSSVLDTAAVEELKKQTARGVFEVEVRLSGEITLGIGNKRMLALSCPLRLQVAPPGREVVLFHEVICKPDDPEKILF